MMTFLLIPHCELIVYLHPRNLLLQQQFQMKILLIVLIEYYDIRRYKEKSNIIDFVKKRLLENSFYETKKLYFSFFQV